MSNLTKEEQSRVDDEMKRVTEVYPDMDETSRRAMAERNIIAQRVNRGEKTDTHAPVGRYDEYAG